MTLAGIRKVIREIHSEPNSGTLSWGRCAATGALVVASTAILYVVFHTHVLPSMTDAGAFVIAPYTANKVATAIQSFSNNPVNAAVVPATAIPSSLAVPEKEST